MELQNYQQSLVKFMDLKSEWIKKHLKIDDYLTDKDRAYLLTLPDLKAKVIWAELEYEIKKRSASSLGVSTCVFCIAVNGKCRDCVYGKNHGIYR